MPSVPETPRAIAPAKTYVVSFQGHGFRRSAVSDLWGCVYCGRTTTNFSEAIVPKCKRYFDA